MTHVLCIGHAAYDMVLPLSHYPHENQKYVLEAKVESGGGPAANAACLLSSWGCDAAFMGQVGNDHYGHAVIDGFRAAGVNLSLLQINPRTPTPHSTILVNVQTGSRTVLNVRPPQKTLAFSDSILLSLRPEVLLLDGHEPDASLRALDLFPASLSILDAGSVGPGTLSLAGKVDYLITSETFALDFCGMTSIAQSHEADCCLKKLSRFENAQVVVTLGERGLLYWKEEKTHHLPAFPAEAVDTTGAGDVFHGAFAYGLLNHLSLTENLFFASAAAALSVQKLGACPSIPSLKTVKTFLSGTPVKE